MRHAGRLGALLAVGLIGCSGEGNAPPSLGEATLVLPAFDSISVTLSGGELRQGEGADLTVRAGLTDWSAVADFNGDGSLEAVAVVWSSGGGSGTFMEVAVFDLVDGAWGWRGSVPLGDRTRVRVLAVSDDVVTLRLVEHGPDDAMCCPTVDVERRFRLTSNGLIAVP